MKKITIIGTGYVGLVSGAGLAEFGHSVSCVDIDQEKIKNLNNGQIPIHEPGLDIIVKNNVKEGRLTFSSNIEKNIQEAKIIFIAVGTPQDEKGIADLTAVKSIVKLIADNLNLGPARMKIYDNWKYQSWTNIYCLLPAKDKLLELSTNQIL